MKPHGTVAAPLLALLLAAPAHAGDARFLIKQGDKFGAIDATGKVVVEPQFDNDFHFADGIARVYVGPKVGFIDTSGKVVISPNAKISSGAGDFASEVALASLIAEDFAEGLAPFKLDRKFGYVDHAGAVVIPAQFDEAGPFVDGRALVAVGGRYGSIDRSGKAVIEPQFDRPYAFAEGLAVARGDGGMGYIDTRGAWVIKPQFNYAYNFAGGRARAQIKTTDGTGYGYIDKAGKVVVPPTLPFRVGSDFVDGRALVRVEGKGWGYIDDSGKFAIEPQFFSARPFAGGLAAVAVGEFSKNKWGFVDRAGKLAVPAEYDRAEDFSDGLALVTLRGEGYYFVDGKGKRVIGPLKDYSQVDAFQDGLARVWFSRVANLGDGEWGYIDRSGKVVWKPS